MNLVLGLNTWIQKKFGELFGTDAGGNTTINTKSVIVDGTTGDEAGVNDSGQLKVVLDGKVDVNNTTSTPLTSGSTYTGISSETLDYALIFVTVYSDVASATDGLCVQISNDGTNWYDGDCFTIAADTHKTFSIQTNTRYYRINYENGSTNQTTFELTTILKKTNSKPSTHRIKDEVSGEDDATLSKSILSIERADGQFVNIDNQNPTPVNLDSVYVSDVDLDNSDNYNFTNGIYDYFDSLKSVNVDSTSNTPKRIKIAFNRTIYASEIGFGCDNLTYNFSNVKLELLGSGDVVRRTIDLSSDGTKLNSLLIPFEPSAFNGIIINFVTTDTVGLSNVTIRKEIKTKSQIVGLKPDGTIVDFKATTAGNFKVSLEELENNLSVNSNTQLKVTQFDSAGNEGQKIIGVDYLSGNSGIDASTETLQTISYEHHEIHSGSHYNYCDYSLNEGSGNTIEFVMTTPNTTKWAHLVFQVYSSEGATLELYEGTTGVTGGTAITPRNNNRNSSNVSDITLIKDPTTITDNGTRASGYLAGGGRTSGVVERGNEFVLKQNTAYLVRITSLAVSNDISWCAEWYEHTNKN